MEPDDVGTQEVTADVLDESGADGPVNTTLPGTNGLVAPITDVPGTLQPFGAKYHQDRIRMIRTISLLPHMESREEARTVGTIALLPHVKAREEPSGNAEPSPKTSDAISKPPRAAEEGNGNPEESLGMSGRTQEVTTEDEVEPHRDPDEPEDVTSSSEPDEQIFVCFSCGDTFKSMQECSEHQEFHNRPSGPPPEVFLKNVDSGSLINDERTHTDKKAFEWQSRKKVLGQNRSLINHERPHLDKKPFKCELCTKGFSQNSSLIVHKRTHRGEKPFKCKICSKSFTASGSLIKHERIHASERPFKCDICTKGFIQRGDLKKHERVHTGEKPFQCQFCTKWFKEQGTVRKHERLHILEKPKKPFKCQFCKRGFSDNGSLLTHQHIHSNEKPFKCRFCPRGFRQQGILIRHERNHELIQSLQKSVSA